MASVQLLQRLPEDLLIFVLSFVAVSTQGLLDFQILCKYFRRILDKQLQDRIIRIKKLLKKHSINLTDPLYLRFAEQIPYTLQLTDENIINFRNSHLNKLLSLSDTPLELLDRVFGYMVEHGNFYFKIFATQESLVADLDFERIKQVRESFIKFVGRNLLRDKFYQMFVDLAQLDGPIRKESAAMGVSYYHQRYCRRNEGFSSRTEIVELLGKIDILCDSSSTLTFRVVVILIYAASSWFIEIFVLTRIFFALHDNSVKLGLLESLLEVSVHFLVCYRLGLVASPTWPLFEAIDEFIQHKLSGYS